MTPTASQAQAAVDTSVFAVESFKYLLQFVVGGIGAYIGARLAFRQFRSQRAFERQTGWEEDIVNAAWTLYHTIEPLRMHITQSPVTELVDMDQLDLRSALRAVSSADVDAYDQARAALQPLLGKAMLYANDAELVACQVLDGVVEEAEKELTAATVLAARIQEACVGVSEDIGKHFRLGHSWRPLAPWTASREKRVQSAYDDTVKRAYGRRATDYTPKGWPPPGENVSGSQPARPV